MQPGRELDALIAERVMGWRNIPTASVPDRPWIDEHGMGFQDLKPYSTDISAAWEVVEKLGGFLDLKRYVLIQGQGMKCIADFVSHRAYGKPSCSAIADTPAHAICLAALKAVEHE